jgi:uncharacterized protein
VSGATADRSTQMAGAAAADVLLEPWFACLRERLPGLRVFDCHTHLGLDPDGSCQTAEELRDALDVVDGRAVTFSLSEPDGYRAANDRMLAAAEASGGRVVAFCRLAPTAGGRGARSIAAPRGSSCTRAPSASRSATPRLTRWPRSPRRGAAIIVHAGRGIPSLGPRRARPRRPATPMRRSSWSRL